MKWENKNPRARLYLIGAVILLLGLGGAILIYLTAEDDSDAVAGYEIVDGSVYPIAPQSSKIYVHDLELYGGKANVLADEFRRWFISLWHGKSLAYTVACVFIFVFMAIIFVAYHLPSGLKSDVQGENKGEEMG